ncbi:uncharacterized protein LOC129597558 [Paramacrobiotus metropolitanus]|uniref:uncharacterized protein LOC129597558 n=1 Tax=Paramacrobiotus metropolitanus TaxID=2943436 RepID=UPI0024459DBA|nr:uncharacterized protein LOC129597558 [Paramacrobiotus metropolitanus]
MTTLQPLPAISAQRLEQLHKESLERLERLHAVVKAWKCSHCSIPSPPTATPPLDGDLAVVAREHNLPIASIRPITYTKEDHSQINEELQIFMSKLHLKSHDKWEKSLLWQQTQVAEDLVEQRAKVTGQLMERLRTTEEIVGQCAKQRVALRSALREAESTAEQCDAELDNIVHQQNDVLHKCDLYIHDIDTEIERLKSYAKNQFFVDQKNCQMLLEHQRLNEDNFEELYGFEKEEIIKQMRIMKADLGRRDAKDRRKFVRKLIWQIRNLRYESVSREKELMQSDMERFEGKLELLKNDVAFMQERYISLTSVDPDAAEADGNDVVAKN